MSEDSKYCWQCRLISGGGLICAGAYVVSHGRKFVGFSRYGVTSIGYGVGLIGALRLFGLPPFRRDEKAKEQDKSLNNKNDEDEYIIGKFSQRFN